MRYDLLIILISILSATYVQYSIRTCVFAWQIFCIRSGLPKEDMYMSVYTLVENSLVSPQAEVGLGVA